MGGVCYVATSIARPGVISRTGPLERLVFGEFDGASSPRAEQFLEACRRGGIKAELSADIRREIWQKFVFLVALSGTTATMRTTIGPIRENPQTRRFLLDLMREVVAVGRAHGVDLPQDYAEQRLVLADQVAPDMTSSMHHDLERGNRLEVRWLAGAVVELGRAVGIDTPLNRAVADILALREAGTGGPAMTAMAVSPALTVRAVRTVAVAVPMRFALGTSAATVREAPLLLVDLETEEGVTGRSYLFCYRPSGAAAIAAVLHDAVALIAGERVSPLHIAAKLERRFALIGVTGVVRMALSALDMALWDALAVAAGQPLATLLGGAPRPIPAYNSCGLGLMAPEAAADEAEQLLAGGFKAVKLRLGHATLAQDLAVTRAVRRRLADDIAVMVDYNQALTVAQALERGRALAHEGVYWIEEPIRHDDLAGHATLVRELALPIQIGENFDGPKAMAQALDAGACDFVMPDAGRIGGVTGWQQAAGVAASRDVEMSSHLMPEVSAHLLAATPTAHWLEYVDWADAILAEPLAVIDGRVTATSKPGTGLAWNDEAVNRYRLA